MTQPLKARPKTGGLMIYFECEFAGCDVPGIGMSKALAVIGWRMKTLHFQIANPSSLVEAMKQALVYKPAAVMVVTVPQQVWQVEIPAYRAAGVKIIASNQADVKLDDTVIAAVAGNADVRRQTDQVVSWFEADSRGSGHALLTWTPSIANEAVFADEAKARLKDCAGCRVTSLETTIAQQGTASATNAVVSALQRDPSIDYVLSGYGPQTPGLPAALSAAGLTKRVRVAGFFGGPTDFTAIQQGLESAFTSQNAYYSGWLAVDATLRNQQGIPFTSNDGGLPSQLFVRANTTDASSAANFDEPASYPATFERLWLAS